MGRELAEPDWPPLTDDELRGVLGRADDPGGLGRQPVVIWRSPRRCPPPRWSGTATRPSSSSATISASALPPSSRPNTPSPVICGFGYSRSRPCCGWPDGQSVLRRGDFCYEAQQVADGVDLYRDAVSWSPYASLGHAYAAGAALARLHLAAADFDLPARPAGVLMNSCQVISAADPLAAANRWWPLGPRWPPIWPGVAGLLTSRPACRR